MLNSVLSEAADMVLDMGLTAALGKESVNLSDQTFERLQNMMEDQEIRWRLVPRLKALTKRVRSYLNGGGTDDEGLRKIRDDALDLSESFASHRKRRDAVQPYQLSKAIHVAAIRRTLRRSLPGASKQDLSDAGLDGVNQVIQFERSQRGYLTDYAYAAFKHYTLTPGISPKWYWQLPSETRSLNPDAMSWLGTKYREVVRGFRKHMRGRDDELSHRPHYVVKMVKPTDLALNGAWVDADPAGFYRCHETSDGYLPIGDAYAPENRGPWGVPQVKPLRRSPAWVESWQKRWDDRSADKADGYRGGPWAFWVPETPPGWTAIGHMVEKLGSGNRPALSRPRIQMFPNSDIVEGAGDGPGFHWTDSGSDADEDVCAHRAYPRSEFFDSDSPRDGILVTATDSVYLLSPGMPPAEDLTFRWIKKELLDGY